MPWRGWSCSSSFIAAGRFISRELQRRTRLSSASVQKELRRLTEMGAVRRAGFRAIGRDHHHGVFAGVSAAAQGELQRAARDFDRLRRERHQAVHATDVTLGEDDLAAVREAAGRLFSAAHAWLSEARPAPPAFPPPPALGG